LYSLSFSYFNYEAFWDYITALVFCVIGLGIGVVISGAVFLILRTDKMKGILMEKHDVVIVGAGPAGLKVAELLGNAGKDVLVIERKREKEIGEKTCAGGLTPKTMKFIPEELYEKVFHSCSVYLNNQAIEYKNENPLIATVDRHKLGQYMLKKQKKQEHLLEQESD